MQNIVYGEASGADIPALVGLLATLLSIEKDFQPDISKQETGLCLLINNTQTATIQVARNHANQVIGMEARN